MDEFNVNDIFANDEKSVPLEENKEEESIKQEIGEEASVETETAENEGESEISDTQPEVKEEKSEISDIFTGREERTDGYKFTEGGEYHYAPTASSTADFNKESEIEAPHAAQNNQYTQNPYRNPYQQSTYRSAPYQQHSYSQPANQAERQYGYSQQPQSQPPVNNHKSSSKGKKVLAFLLAVVLILGSIGIGISIGRNNTTTAPNYQTTDTATPPSTGESATLTTQPATNQTPVIAGNVSPGIDVAKKARGSVVGVTVYDASGKLYGEGSGVVMGLNTAKTLTYIITCAHVVSDKSIKSCGVLMSDGTVYPATIVGYDERTDIAVLSVTKTNLEVAQFGDSTALQVGETVYAIGNPGGSEFYGSMTSGIVSALDRSISSTYTMTVIQHNAAISPGNSGGALVNSQGQVVGINSSKISATDYEGIAFAVPISVARPVVENLIQYGYVPNRPKLGISYASVTNYWRYSAIVQSKGLPHGSIIIGAISEDSSFKGTEVAVGDMITSVNGKDLEKTDYLFDVIDKSKVGDTLKLGICRIERSSVGGTYTIKQFDVNVTLVEDKGSQSAKDQEETTTQSFYDYYYGNGNGDNFNNFEDFFSQFFGN